MHAQCESRQLVITRLMSPVDHLGLESDQFQLARFFDAADAGADISKDCVWMGCALCMPGRSALLGALHFPVSHLAQRQT
jgi:hypothetical protein